jgi:hypothetical protein
MATTTASATATASLSIGRDDADDDSYQNCCDEF